MRGDDRVRVSSRSTFMSRHTERARSVFASGLISLTAWSLNSAFYTAAAQGMHSRSFSFSIHATSVEDGLKRLQQETGVNLVFSPEQVQGRGTDGLSGNFTVEDAIRHLLQGTGLDVINNRDTFFVIVEAETAPGKRGFIKTGEAGPPVAFPVNAAVEEILIPECASRATVTTHRHP